MPQEDAYEEPTAVYIHTHIIRPAYRDAVSEYMSERSFNLAGGSNEDLPGMDRLKADIQEQLDEQFQAPPVDEEEKGGSTG